MTKAQVQLVLDLFSRRISENEFLTRFPLKLAKAPEVLREELQLATKHQDSGTVEHVMIVAKRFGLLAGLTDIMRTLCFEDWHMQHENIAMAFQQLKDPLAVDGLYHMATTRYPYLDYDEAYALAVKCIWALKAIDTPLAGEKLRLLAKSDNPIIVRNARERLASMDQTAT